MASSGDETVGRPSYPPAAAAPAGWTPAVRTATFTATLARIAAMPQVPLLVSLRLSAVMVAATSACASLIAQQPPAPAFSIAGLAGPEAVRYDPDQDVWFIANFNGDASGDSNGFISRVSAAGTIESLRFMIGTAEAPMHGPRGMFITGDTLWAADARGIHGFDRRSGAHVAFVDLSGFDPGFPNDIAQGPDGALYVTDTGRSRLYRIVGRAASIAVEDPALGPPNGITWDASRGRFLVAGWGEGGRVRAWRPGEPAFADVGTATTGRFDGIEVVDGGVLVASQTDSSLHVIVAGVERVLFQVPGRPADIGVDTRRLRVAVPYIALNRVDVWDLPADWR